MDKARELSGCDAVVVAMSGDFVQRGAPAVMDKYNIKNLQDIIGGVQNG